MAGASDGDVDRALAAMGASVPLKYHSFGVITVRPAGTPPPAQGAGPSGPAAGFRAEVAHPAPSSVASSVFPLLGKALPEAFQVDVEPDWPSFAPVAAPVAPPVARRETEFVTPPAVAPIAPVAPTVAPLAAQPEPYSPFTLPPWLQPVPPPAPPQALAPQALAPQAGAPSPFDETDRTMRFPAAGGRIEERAPSFPAWLDPAPPLARQHGFASLESEQQSFAAPMTPPPVPEAGPAAPAEPPAAVVSAWPPPGTFTLLPSEPAAEPPTDAWPPAPWPPAPFPPASFPPASFPPAPLPLPREEPPMFREGPMASEPAPAEPEETPAAWSQPAEPPAAIPPAAVPAARKPLADLFRTLGARPAPRGTP